MPAASLKSNLAMNTLAGGEFNFCTFFPKNVLWLTFLVTDYASGSTCTLHRYNVPEGPSCNQDTDFIPDESGLCVCTGTRVQDTPFGCRAAAVASRAAVRRSARSMIMPGQQRHIAF